MENGMYVVTLNGRSVSRKFHLAENCSTIGENGEGSNVERITEKEANLLGLKVCVVCEKRANGGPVIAALTELLSATPFSDFESGDEERLAWFIVDHLRDKGMYISSRRKKDAE